MEISAKQVNDLRKQTGLGLMDCKKALVEAEGDVNKAIEVLRKRGLASAGKKASREVHEGVIASYIHTGGRIGVLLEINCETDFVAKNEEFLQLTQNIGMHIAAMHPLHVIPEEVPAEAIEKEKEIFMAQVEGKPAQAIPGIVEGKLKKWYSEICLLDQKYFIDQDKTVRDVINEAIAKLGENIKVRRFVRYQVGD